MSKSIFFFQSIKNNYSYFGDTLKNYWNMYGGFNALLTSPYVHISLLITILLYRQWISPNWWDVVLDITPSILGFALGGYAILISFGDLKFHELISGSKDGNRSPYLGTSSNFVHFILVQIIALLTAVILKTFYSPPIKLLIVLFDYLNLPLMEIMNWIRLTLWAGSFFLFVYSLLTALAATLQIFNVSRWLDKYYQKNEDANK